MPLPYNQMAQKILEWNTTDRISCNSNAIFVDFCDASPGKIGYSIFNNTFAEQGISLCRALLRGSILNPKDIVILTHMKPNTAFISGCFTRLTCNLHSLVSIKSMCAKWILSRAREVQS